LYSDILVGEDLMDKIRVLNFGFPQDDQVNSLLSKELDSSLFLVVGRPRGRDLSEEETCELIKDASILLIDPSGPQITRKVLEAANDLKFIQFTSVGYDQIDLDAATTLGIPVANNPGWAATAVAELAILHILAILRYSNPGFENRERFRIAKELKGKTLGIIGLGSIGKELTKLAQGFGAKIKYYKRSRLNETEEVELGVEYASFKQLLKDSDILSIHTPLTAETQGLIGYDEIQSMKDGAFLVNTARKEIIDEKAVLEALNSGKLAGFGVDFPLDSQLSGSENVFVTNHIGAATLEGSIRVRKQYIANLCRAIKGEKTLYIVNKIL
jgi:phosphoglycerate dehydrogenase-like enzyme